MNKCLEALQLFLQNFCAIRDSNTVRILRRGTIMNWTGHGRGDLLAEYSLIASLRSECPECGKLSGCSGAIRQLTVQCQQVLRISDIRNRAGEQEARYRAANGMVSRLLHHSGQFRLDIVAPIAGDGAYGKQRSGTFRRAVAKRSRHAASCRAAPGRVPAELPRRPCKLSGIGTRSTSESLQCYGYAHNQETGLRDI